MKRSTYGSIFSLIAFIVLINVFFTNGFDFNFSSIFTIFIGFSILSGILRNINGNNKKNSTNEEDNSYTSRTFNWNEEPKNTRECEYCGHLNDVEREYCENCGAKQLSD